MSRLFTFAPSLIALTFLGWAQVLFAAPRPDLWKNWQAHNPNSQIQVDHGSWDRFLKAYVVTDHPSGINRVRYEAVTSSDKQALADYLDGLADLPVLNLTRGEQLAYWINLYNALTIQVILDHYPVESIRHIDISPGWFADGPWGKKLIQIEGEKVSLDDIEHRILRPIWKDNRIHYAVNCASLGCPNLQPEAFTANNMDTLLNKGAREYINHRRGVRPVGNTLYLSSIYDWFQIDFGGSKRGVIAHLVKYADESLAEALSNFDGTVKYNYDWGLNRL